MIIPDDLDLDASDDEIIERLVASGSYDRGAAQYVLSVLRGEETLGQPNFDESNTG